MIPQIKLALIFAQFAQKHGTKILHANNPDLLTKDLGNAMKEQKRILSDARKGMIMTGYDLIPVIVEVKVLTFVVAKKLGIETKGKADIAIIEDIIAKSDERNGGKYAKDVKDTLEWTRELFSHPEIQDVLKMEMTDIEAPKSLKDVFKFFKQVAGRTSDELTRVSEFLKRARDVQPPAPKPEPKSEPKGADPAP